MIPDTLFLGRSPSSARKHWRLISFGPDRVGMQIATTVSKPYRALTEENGPMRIDQESSLAPRWIVFGTALVYFALGSVLTAHFMHLREAWADSHRAFQLEISHRPGNVPVMEERCRSASNLQARHGLAVAGYWVPEDAKLIQTNPAFAKTFVYLMGHASREEAKTR